MDSRLRSLNAGTMSVLLTDPVARPALVPLCY